MVGDHELLGNGKVEHALPLEYLNDQLWQVRLAFPKPTVPDTDINYRYVLRNTDGSIIEDWGQGRVINPARLNSEEVLIVDSWNNPGYFENAFYTEPFEEVLMRRNRTELRLPASPTVTHTFRVRAPLLTRGQTLGILGEGEILRHWNTDRPVLLGREQSDGFFAVRLDLSQQSFPLSYKYGVYDLERKRFLRYEDGSNRTLIDTISQNKQTVVNDGFAVLPSTTWKGAGVAIPVFSLRTEAGFGVGEFGDLKLLADWCAKTGLKLIQILPVNDTTSTHTSTDSYPYAAISAFALHPLYLNLSQVAGSRHKELLAELEWERLRLNALPNVDYEAVLKAKVDFLRQIYPLEKTQTFERDDYRRFFESNRDWLVPYAAFCFLRDKYGTADFKQWPEAGTYQADAADALASEGSETFDEVAFNYFVQFHLHLQLQEATQYAHSKGVILKGDIAIGVARHGADAWQAPELFKLDTQAGAPPDAFSAKGQNWGFPTYNWPRMQETGFTWWKQRFEQMACYFDAFRIDHILGFFRIWSIPAHAVEGILGYFVPALPLHINEFSLRGIWFDRDRYTLPFITDRVLSDLFGRHVQRIKREFLVQNKSGGYSLRDEFGTQRQVERYFATLELSEQNAKLKQGLFDLISNVILFEVEGSQGQQYHFRLGIQTTSSFQNLDPQTRAQLEELYVDYFFRRQEEFWKQQALQKLPALKRATNMLVCGEDLGMVPACVPEVMKELGLLSLEIQRMPKALGQQFSRPAEAPYLSVVTPGSHDMSTIRGWWKEERDLIQRFYNQELGLLGVAPEEGEPWLNKRIVEQHLASPAMWSIFQMQDLLGMEERLRRDNPDEERINVPANPKNYWRYRMHLTLERLLGEKAFNDALRNSIHLHAR
jgi:4-alpha-glucanotransferase